MIAVIPSSVVWFSLHSRNIRLDGRIILKMILKSICYEIVKIGFDCFRMDVNCGAYVCGYESSGSLKVGSYSINVLASSSGIILTFVLI